MLTLYRFLFRVPVIQLRRCIKLLSDIFSYLGPERPNFRNYFQSRGSDGRNCQQNKCFIAPVFCGSMLKDCDGTQQVQADVS